MVVQELLLEGVLCSKHGVKFYDRYSDGISFEVLTNSVLCVFVFVTVWVCAFLSVVVAD